MRVRRLGPFRRKRRKHKGNRHDDNYNQTTDTPSDPQPFEMEEPIYPAAVSHYSNQVVPEYPVLLSGIEQVMEEDYYKHMYSVGGLGEVPADFAQQVVEQQGKLIGKKVIDAD